MTKQQSTLLTEVVISDDKRHCYLVHKVWNSEKKSAMVILRNPTQADAIQMNETLIRIINNLDTMDFGSVYIVFLFSVVTKKIRFWNRLQIDLLEPENDFHIFKSAQKSDLIIFAWGKDFESNKKAEKRVGNIMNGLQIHKDKFFTISDIYGHLNINPASSYGKNEWVLEKFYSDNIEDLHDVI